MCTALLLPNCRDAFLRLSQLPSLRDRRFYSAILLAETQECVSTTFRRTQRKLIIGQCVDSNALAKQIASHTTFSRGEIVAVIDYLWSYMAENLGEGDSVKIDGLGVFTPSLAYRKGVERETEDGEGGRRNATSFCVGSINFRPGEKAHERCQ